MGDSKRNLCLLLGICFQVVNGHHKFVQSVHEWQTLEFDYETNESLQNDISTGYYVPGVGAPIDVDIYYAVNQPVKTFTTIPRFTEGIPVTLGTISGRKSANGNPIITPYPNWSYQRTITKPTPPNVCNPDRIVSVFRVKIDECGRLWVMDAGRVGDNIICPPQILAFDLKTDKRIVKYELPSSQYEPRSVFVTPIVDVVSTANRCQNTFVYMADCQAFSIVVFDQARMKSWRIIDKTFYPYPNYGTFNIEGDSFDLMDGILGMDLEPKYSGMRDRKLFYHSLSAGTENWVYTSYLKDESRFASDPSSSPGIFNTYPLTRPSQSAAIAIDRNGIAFFANLADTTLLCWNIRTPYWGPYTDVVEKNATTLQFPSGVKVVTNTYGVQELWVLTNSFQKVAAQTLSKTSANFRMLAGYTSELLSGSNCVNHVKK